MLALLMNPLFLIALILSVTLVANLMTPARYIATIRCTTLTASIVALVIGIISCLGFDKSLAGFQYLGALNFIPEYNLSFTFGVDGLSMIFLLLTLFIFPVLFVAAWSVSAEPKQFWSHLLGMELLLVLTFTTLDILYFFILFESLLIPMFILIGVWGARERKIKAAYYFFLYTLFGSLFMLFGVFYLYFLTGSTNYFVLLNSQLGQEQQFAIWLCFFIAFAVKMPLFPLHIWLPEAHVEAPTVGSMLLASLLLKLGGYGFLRFSLTFLSAGSFHYTPLVSTCALMGVIYGSLSTIRQIDLKRVIAYSSVAHMNLVMLGLFSGTQQGLEGAIYLMVGHGVVSTALFFCVGVLYDRHHSRLLRYYGGLVTVMPLFSGAFFIFTLANMGFPGTSNFLGELLVFIGIFHSFATVALLSTPGIVLGAVYSTLLYARVIFGSLKEKYNQRFTDLTRREAAILVVLTIMMIALGVASDFILSFVHVVVKTMVISNPTASVETAIAASNPTVFVASTTLTVNQNRTSLGLLLLHTVCSRRPRAVTQVSMPHFSTVSNSKTPSNSINPPLDLTQQNDSRLISVDVKTSQNTYTKSAVIAQGSVCTTAARPLYPARPHNGAAKDDRNAKNTASRTYRAGEKPHGVSTMQKATAPKNSGGGTNEKGRWLLYLMVASLVPNIILACCVTYTVVPWGTLQLVLDITIMQLKELCGQCPRCQQTFKWVDFLYPALASSFRLSCFLLLAMWDAFVALLVASLEQLASPFVELKQRYNFACLLYGPVSAWAKTAYCLLVLGLLIVTRILRRVHRVLPRWVLPSFCLIAVATVYVQRWWIYAYVMYNYQFQYYALCSWAVRYSGWESHNALGALAAVTLVIVLLINLLLNLAGRVRTYARTPSEVIKFSTVVVASLRDLDAVEWASFIQGPAPLLIIIVGSYTILGLCQPISGYNHAMMRSPKKTAPAGSAPRGSSSAGGGPCWWLLVLVAVVVFTVLYVFFPQPVLRAVRLVVLLCADREAIWDLASKYPSAVLVFIRDAVGALLVYFFGVYHIYRFCSSRKPRSIRKLTLLFLLPCIVLTASRKPKK